MGTMANSADRVCTVCPCLHCFAKIKSIFRERNVVFFKLQPVTPQYILKTKSNFTLLLYIPFLGVGELYFKCS